MHLALGGDEHRAVRANLDFFLKLRNQIAHRYLPALDTEIVGEAQAMLLNFEELLLAKFGKEATLGEQLAVPLQLSGFRSDGSLLIPPQGAGTTAGERVGLSLSAPGGRGRRGSNQFEVLPPGVLCPGHRESGAVCRFGGPICAPGHGDPGA